MPTPAFIADRTVQVGANLYIHVRVSRTTALLWEPQYENNPGLLNACADGRAMREAYEILRERRIGTGLLRVTWSGMRRDVELLEPPAE
jgi:hypothetical protein